MGGRREGQALEFKIDTGDENLHLGGDRFMGAQGLTVAGKFADGPMQGDIRFAHAGNIAIRRSLEHPVLDGPQADEIALRHARDRLFYGEGLDADAEREDVVDVLHCQHAHALPSAGRRNEVTSLSETRYGLPDRVAADAQFPSEFRLVDATAGPETAGRHLLQQEVADMLRQTERVEE